MSTNRTPDTDLPEFLFVCVGPNCGERGGNELARSLKERLVERGEWGRCRVVPCNCFGQCATGPNACSTKSKRFLSGLDPEDVDRVLRELTTPETESPD